MFRILVIAVLSAAATRVSALEQNPTSSAGVADFKPIALYDDERICLKGFEKGNLIFIAKGYKLKGFKNSFTVAIYNPATGLLVLHPIPEWQGLECEQVRMSESVRIDRYDLQRSLRYASGKTRSILDQYVLHPDGIKELIPKPGEYAPYSYLNDTIVVRPSARYYETIGEAAAYVGRFNEEQAKSLARREQQERERYAAIQKADFERQKAQKLAVQQATLSWDTRLSYPLAVGDRVCSYETNFIGDVEAIGNDRGKVHVIAKAASTSPGALFASAQSISVTNMETLRWFNRDDFAKCEWTDTPSKSSSGDLSLTVPTRR